MLAASALPASEEELQWLREQGLQIIVSLTEDPLPRRWIDDAGLMSIHIPIPDMDVPTEEQFTKCISIIERATRSGMGVLLHCMAGKGRTGTILAAYLVNKGMTSRDAIQHIRRIRPGSIETADQEQAIHDYARRHRS